MTQTEVKEIADELMKGLKAIHDEDTLVSIRAIGENFASTGVYDDTKKMLRDVFEADRSGEFKGIYWNLNSFTTSGKLKITNALRVGNPSIENSDVTRRCWIPIDVDPNSPKGLPATDEESGHTRTAVDSIVEMLRDTQQWPDPIILFTGNGYQAFYPADLPNTDEATALVNGLLKMLDAAFTDDKASIDLKVSDPSRCTKFPGTMSRKGTEQLGRPHRRSRLISVPPITRRLAIDDLKKMEHLFPGDLGKPRSRKGEEPNENRLIEWVEGHLPNGVVSKVKRLDKATLFELEKCPFNPDHVRTARIVLFPTGGAHFGCFHNSCQDKNWPKLVKEFDPDGDCRKVVGSSAKNRNEFSELRQKLDLFRDQFSETFVRLPSTRGHRTLHVDSTEVRQYFTNELDERDGSPPSQDVVNRLIAATDAKARFHGQERAVFRRVGHHCGSVYVDLYDDAGTAVEINPDGWKLTESSPVLFEASGNAIPLPKPVRGGSLDLLRKYLVTINDEDFGWILGWLISCFSPDSPYPILCIEAESGHGKSTLNKMLKSLIDPSIEKEAGGIPRESQDMAVAAWNNFLLAFSNVSSVSAEQADMLCLMSTGGCFRSRTLYTQRGETSYPFKRPVLLDGIGFIPNRADFIGRLLQAHPQPFAAGALSTERKLWRQFEEDRPLILGALYSAVSSSLRHVEEDVPDLPRMADFFTFVRGAQIDGHFPKGIDFIGGYSHHVVENTLDGLIDSPILLGLQQILSATPNYENSATSFLSALREMFPKSDLPIASKLMGELRRLSPALDALGISWTGGRNGKGSKYTFTRSDEQGAPSESHKPSDAELRESMGMGDSAPTYELAAATAR
jgi:hypothetical protein